MRNGLSAGPLPRIPLPFRDEIERACEELNFSPLVAYAIKVNETNLSTDPGEIQIGADPKTLCMPDGSPCGVGIFQLTSSHPDGWRDPYVCALEAIRGWLIPAETFWSARGMQAEDLVRAIAASFNAGIGGAEQGHAEGDIGKFTTFSGGVSYADRALNHYRKLLKGQAP